MKAKLTRTLPLLALTFCVGGANAGTFMDAQWAAEMCKAWNSSNLPADLGGAAWAANNANRGYKIIHLYRDKCGAASKVELEISDKGGKAECSYGGAVKHATLNHDVDYLMYATDEDWTCMGEGKFGCGAMGAMMTGKLKFKGPKGEAMGVELREIEANEADGTQVVTLAVPKESIEHPDAIEEVRVVARAPEEPEPLEIKYEWLDDYDEDNYGLVIHLGKGNWPIRLYMNSNPGFIRQE